MNVIFTCGGTAGHVNPALALAGYMQKQDPQVQVLFVGTPDGMERDLVEKAGYAFRGIPMGGFQRSLGHGGLAHNLRSLSMLTKSHSRARAILRDFRPDLVVGTGGYASYPVVKCAAGMGIPTAVHESNMVPGLTTKMLEGSADRIMVGFEECRRHYRLAENFKFYSAVVGFLVGLGVVLSVAKTEFIQYSPEYIPIVILLFVMAVVYALGGWISRKLVKKYGDETYFRVFDIPEMAEMAELGWFVYRDEQEKTRLLLTKKKPREHFCFFSDDPRQPGDE